MRPLLRMGPPRPVVDLDELHQDLLELIGNLLIASCADINESHVEVDSTGIAPYTQAIRLLCSVGRLEMHVDDGDRVVARVPWLSVKENAEPKPH